jgi:hypothetical protein
MPRIAIVIVGICLKIKFSCDFQFGNMYVGAFHGILPQDTDLLKHYLGSDY